MSILIPALLGFLLLSLVFMLVFGTRPGASRPHFFGTWITAGGMVAIALIVFFIFYWLSPGSAPR